MAREYVKCKYCGEQAHIDDRIRYEYENRNGKLTKVNLHKKCVQLFEKKLEDDKKRIRIEKLLLNIGNVPAIQGSWMVGLNNIVNGVDYSKGNIKDKSKSYNWDVIYDAIIEKQKDIEKHFEKPFNYIRQIILDGCVKVYRRKQEVKDNTNNNEEIIEQINIIKSLNKNKKKEEKKDEVDITTLFE